TPDNVKEECFTTALECLKKELNGTVKAECNDDNDYIGQGVKVLQIMIKKTQEKNHVSISPHYALNSSECSCERWSETSFSEFLNKTEDLCEHIYSALTKS
uniref:SWIM-type domain-containing protein n=1 Tax=Anabas testudineus TaxID=64144 RepID=A0AAQ6IMH8_ANATE